MPWYRYHQNNSGGDWDYDEERGIGINVYVEAADPAAADRRAKDIGLYFADLGDCECCGPRWEEAWDDDEPPPPRASGPLRYDWDGYGMGYAHPQEGPFYLVDGGRDTF